MLAAGLLPAASAGAPVRLHADMKTDQLWSRLEFVEDPGKALTLGQVRAPPAARFTSLTRDNFIRGLTE